VNPTILSQYLRVVFVYVLGIALAAGGGYVVIAHGNYTSPIVYVAISYWSTILGVHVNNISSPTPSVATDPAVDPSVIAQSFLSGAASANSTPSSDVPPTPVPTPASTITGAPA
jgi:hypothetical protein